MEERREKRREENNDGGRSGEKSGKGRSSVEERSGEWKSFMVLVMNYPVSCL